jgi:hypothetical protein
MKILKLTTALDYFCKVSLLTTKEREMEKRRLLVWQDL